jgi:hypothetical protein
VNKNAVQGFYGRRTASYKDFTINRPRPAAFYAGADEVVVEIDPQSQGADYWAQNRHEDLTAKEQAIYHMVDTMKTIPRFRTYVDRQHRGHGLLHQRPSRTGPLLHRVQLQSRGGEPLPGGRAHQQQLQRWVPNSNGYAAYGTKDERFKFGLATTFISKEPRQLYQATYKHDVEQLGQSINAFRNDNILGSAFRRTPNNKLTDVEEWTGQFGARVVHRDSPPR